MHGKVCIVTGSNSGIGKETALALSQRTAKVVMVVRNREKGEKAQKEIIGKTGNRETFLMICDLSSKDSIVKFTERFLDKFERLDVLINNAGAVFSKRQITIDGFERTLAVNYLGPFLLTNRLLPLLKSSAPSRIINLTSGLHKSGNIDFNDLQSEKNYKGMNVYKNAKLMIIMYTYELARYLEGTKVTANVAQPGFVATNLGRNSGSRLSSLSFKMMRPFQVSAKKGAETSVYLASSKKVENITGRCFLRMRETTTTSISYNRQIQKLLWNTTMKMLDLDQDMHANQ